MRMESQQNTPISFEGGVLGWFFFFFLDYLEDEITFASGFTFYLWYGNQLF